MQLRHSLVVSTYLVSIAASYTGCNTLTVTSRVAAVYRGMKVDGYHTMYICLSEICICNVKI